MVPPISQPSPTPAHSAEDDPFRYGWRYVKRELPDGTVDFDQVPLTLEDVLHPEEEDFHILSDLHTSDCAYLLGVFRSRPLGPPIARVTCDLRIDWEVEGLRPHGPDLTVFVGMKHPPELADGTLYVKAAGGRCLLAIEIVSPSTRVNDVTHKVAHYHQAGVPLYVIVDQEREGGPRSIIAYRWAESGYQRQPLDKEGRLLLEPLGLYLSLADGRVVCHDAATGKKLGDHAQSLLDLDAADRRSLEQEQVIEEAILARQAADRKSREDNQVREEAERKSREDTQARKEAERKSREDTQAREEAEWQARKAVEVQAALEERLRQLEEQLRSRRNGATGSDPAASA